MYLFNHWHRLYHFLVEISLLRRHSAVSKAWPTCLMCGKSMAGASWSGLRLKHNYKTSNVHIRISCILFLVYQHFIALIQIREQHPRHCTSAASVEFLFIQQCPPTMIFRKALENRASGVGPRPRSQGRFKIAGDRTWTGSGICSDVTTCATPALHISCNWRPLECSVTEPGSAHQFASPQTRTQWYYFCFLNHIIMVV